MITFASLTMFGNLDSLSFYHHSRIPYVGKFWSRKILVNAYVFPNFLDGKYSQICKTFWMAIIWRITLQSNYFNT